MSRYVDFSPDGEAIGQCVILPGRQYTPDGPLLFFAAMTALAHGWAVRQVWWEAPERGTRDLAEEGAWVGNELDAALAGHHGRALVVGKSLGTLGAAAASVKGYDAVWLTPLLTEPTAAAPLLNYPARQLVAIGSSDPFFDQAVFNQLPGRRVLVDGDHVLVVPGRPLATVASHDLVVRALDAWLSASE
ncbi:MAG: hypothetical protein ACTHK1_10370 [Actinomycetales bacterium]